MLKEVIEYVDYDGVQRKEEHYFHLSESEIAEMELSTKGGLIEKLNMIVKAEDGEAIIKFFKDFLLKSYGVRSADGRRFDKPEKLREEFSWSLAYDVLFMRLVREADYAAKFINGVVPATLAAKAEAEAKK